MSLRIKVNKISNPKQQLLHSSNTDISNLSLMITNKQDKEIRFPIPFYNLENEKSKEIYFQEKQDIVLQIQNDQPYSTHHPIFNKSIPCTTLIQAQHQPSYMVELCFQSCVVSVELVYVYSRLINHCGSLHQLINLSGMKFFQPSEDFLTLPTSLQSENNEIHEETGERLNNCC